MFPLISASRSTGTFPVPEDSEAYIYDQNPATISASEFSVDLPANPELADEASCVSLGFMLDGAFFFNALDGPGRDAVAHEIQGLCDGHPERTGAYHHHNQGSCQEDIEEGEGHSPLMGCAIDGFGHACFADVDIPVYTDAMKIVKVRRVGNSNVVSIPREFEAHGYAPGTSVLVEELDGELRIMRTEQLRERIRSVGKRVVSEHPEALRILAEHDPGDAEQTRR